MTADVGSLRASLGLDAAEYISGLTKADLAAQKLEATQKRQSAAIDRHVAALQKSADLMGRSTQEVTLYNLAAKGASDAQLAAANAALKHAAAQERLEAAFANSDAIDKQIAAMQRSVDLYGKSSDQITRYDLAARGATGAQLALADALFAQSAAQAQASKAEAFIAGLEREAAAAGKTRAEILALQAAQLGVAETAAPLIAKVTQAGKGVGDLGKTNKLTAYETQQLSYQLNDFFVQVASGQSPLTALIQQGSQLSGTFNGIGGALKAIGSLFTLTNIAIAAGVAAVAAIGAAWYQGSQRAKEFQKGIALTGNYAGLTADQFETSAKAAAEYTKSTVGASKDVLQALAATGQYGPQSIQSVTQAVLEYAKASGKSADEVVGDFASMSDGVADFALKQDKQLHVLDASTLKYIQSLEAQGKTDLAAKVAADAITDGLKARERQLSGMEGTLDKAKRTWSEFWDSATAVGRPTTVQDKLTSAQKALEAAGQVAASAPGDASAQTGSVLLTPGRRGALPRPVAASDATGILQGNVDQLAQQRDAETSAAAKQAADLQAQREKNLQQSTAYQSALSAIEQAGIGGRLAAAELSAEKERAALEKSYDAGALTTIRSYETARYAIEKQALDAREAALNAEIELEKKRRVTTPEASKQQEANVSNLENQRFSIRGDRVKLDEAFRTGALAPADAGAKLSADLDRLKQAQKLQTDSYQNAERLVEATRQAGLIDEQTYYEARRGFIDLNRQANEDEIQSEIARLKQEGEGLLNGKAQIANQRAIADAEARLTKVRQDAAVAFEINAKQQTAYLAQIQVGYLKAEQAEMDFVATQRRSYSRNIGSVRESSEQTQQRTGRDQITDRFDDAQRDLDNTKEQLLLANQFTAEQQAQYAERSSILATYKAKSLAEYDDYYKRLRAAQADWSNGGAQAMQTYLDTVANTAKLTNDLFTQAFNGIEDSLTNLLTTGKGGLRALTNTLATDITRVGVKQFEAQGLKLFQGSDLASSLGLGASTVGKASDDAARTYSISVTTSQLTFLGSAAAQAAIALQALSTGSAASSAFQSFTLGGVGLGSALTGSAFNSSIGLLGGTSAVGDLTFANAGSVAASTAGDLTFASLGYPLSEGTNRVPYDGFQATLHKDEAVVPAAFNPWANGSPGLAALTAAKADAPTANIQAQRPLIQNFHFADPPSLRTQSQIGAQAYAGAARAAVRNN